MRTVKPAQAPQCCYLGLALLSSVACAKTEPSDTDAQSTTSDSSVGSEASLPDLPPPATCESPALPAFSDNGCMDSEERVTVESSGSQPVDDPPAEVTENSWALPCVVTAVEMATACQQLNVVMLCDNEGSDEEYQVGFSSSLGAQLDLLPGEDVEYRVDAYGEFECCTRSATRISDSAGLVYGRAQVSDAVEHAMTESVVAMAFETLEGRRSAPTCDTATGSHEYSLELTVDGEVVAIPDDTALDVGNYRVLVDHARSKEATPDQPIANFFEATVIRVAG